MTRFSPDYPDTDPHGGFNPNYTFPTDLNVTCNGSPAIRRGPFPFGHPGAQGYGYQFAAGSSNQGGHNLFGGMAPGDAVMHTIIQDGSQVAAINYTQEEADAYVEEEAEVEYDEEGEEEAVEEPPAAGSAAAKKKAAGKKPAGGSRGPKWISLEDECLAEA